MLTSRPWFIDCLCTLSLSLSVFRYARNISLQVNNKSIVSGDAQQPHYFTKDQARHPLPQGTDWLTTCAYNTEGTNATVQVGSGHNNEMCNMFVLFPTLAASQPHSPLLLPFSPFPFDERS